MGEQAKVLLGSDPAVSEWLKACGIIRQDTGELPQRVILDIPADGIVRIWVSWLNSESMLQHALDFSAAEFVKVETKP